MDDFYLGKRLSYDGCLCIVRYIGDVVGTKGRWLGVEWDDPTRGKHAGAHNAVRYFECKRHTSTAGSFVRPNRPHDSSLDVNDSIRKKYASNSTASGKSATIHISGKEVEEVGFEKINQQLSDLQALQIVLVDHLCVASSAPISDLCPNIQELDLSRNLFEKFESILEIAIQLPHLSSLRIDGNRFYTLETSSSLITSLRVTSLSFLSLDDTLMSWSEIASVASYFPGLKCLSAGANQLQDLNKDPLPSSIVEIRLEGNQLKNLESIRALFALKSLQKLALKDNSIRDLFSSTPIDSSINDIDLARNEIFSWEAIEKLGRTFPSLRTLRVSNNPLYRGTNEDVDFLETVARLEGLTMLNYSQINPKEHRSAETFYLSKIGNELSSVSITDESAVMSRHPRYKDLCQKYGEPIIKRVGLSTMDPESLQAGLVRCVLELDANMMDGRLDASRVVEKEIPRRFTINSILGIIGKTFGIKQPGLLELLCEDNILNPATRPLGMFVDGSSAKILIRWDMDRVKQCMQYKNRITSNNLAG